MKILALEFSTNQRGIALQEGPKVVSRVFSQGQATPVFELISSALAEANWSMPEIDLVAAGLGPGSYTGVRLAIATVQGIV